MAGEAAFFAAVAVFPALLTVVAVVRAAEPVFGPGAQAAAVGGLTRLLRVVLTTQGSTAADAAAALLSGDSGGPLTLGSLAALLLLTRALRSVLYTLGVQAGWAPRRMWPRALGLALLTLVGGALVVAAAVQDPLRLLGMPGGDAVWSVARWPVTAIALAGWAAALLRAGLGRRGRRAVLPAAAAVAGGWVLASALFPLYVTVAARTSTLGTLGGALILLVWVYLLVLMLYFGAELCLLLDARRTPAPDDATRPGDAPDERGGDGAGDRDGAARDDHAAGRRGRGSRAGSRSGG